MSKEIKFTTDGKKVVVIGSLNSQEKIVQEIFVIDGSEIPSGEHFVVKSLHDAPAISWKEHELKKIEERYEQTHKQKTAEYEKMSKDFDFKVRVIKEKLSFLRQLETNLSVDKTTQLIDFISGDVKYIVKEDWCSFDIAEYDSTIATKEYDRFESIRLLSVFGRTDGNLSYKMNQYYDGSGGWYNIYPCKTMEDALVLLKEKFSIAIEKGLTCDLLKVAEKFKIEIPNEKMEEYRLNKRKTILENIEKQKQHIRKYEEELSKY